MIRRKASEDWFWKKKGLQSFRQPRAPGAKSFLCISVIRRCVNENSRKGRILVELIGVNKNVELRRVVVSGTKADKAKDVAEEDMSAETEIEVSVVSEEDLDLEASRSTSTPTDMLLQEKSTRGGCGLGNPFSFDVAKAAMRPACNPQYTSFSIESILGHPESPTADATSAISIERQSSDHERSSPPLIAPPSSHRIILSCDSSPSDTLLSPSSHRTATNNGTRNSTTNNHHSHDNSRTTNASAGIATSATSPASYTSGDPANPLMGHQASTDLAMLSR